MSPVLIGKTALDRGKCTKGRQTFKHTDKTTTHAILSFYIKL